MLSIGMDTHEKEHWIEIQNSEQMKMWNGKITNNRDGFNSLLEKIHTVEKSNNQDVMGIFMNPTGNYHMPLKHFLEINGFKERIFLVDARRTEHMRTILNLGKEKSDPEDAHILASVPWLDKSYVERRGHERSPLSDLTRFRESVNNNISRIKNFICADLAIIFPEFRTLFDIESKTGLILLEKYTTPENISKISLKVLSNLICKASKNHYKKEDAANLIQIAKDSIGVPDEDNTFTIRIRTNIERLKREIETTKKLSTEIENRSKDNQDVKNLSNMRGIGNNSAATIVSEIGDIKQFNSVEKLQSYGGKCPDMTGSGGKVYAKKVTKIRNSYLSNTVYECAVSLVTHKNHEFSELFDREIDKNKTKTEAYIVVGKRLLYHIYSIMKNGKPYRERNFKNVNVGGGGYFLRSKKKGFVQKININPPLHTPLILYR